MTDDALLFLISSGKPFADDFRREWPLKEGHRYLIGRGDEKELLMDFSFDPAVSRRHVEIWSEDGSWRIRDTSAYGTRINGRRIPAKEDIRLKYDDEMKIGNKTVLRFMPASRAHALWKDLLFEADIPASLNYALMHNNFPFMETVTIRNCGGIRSEPFELRLQLGEGFDTVYEVPVLDRGALFEFKPQIKLKPYVLEEETESFTVILKMTVRDAVVLEHTVRILAHNEWSEEGIAYHRTSLASFVLPNHPYVERIMTEMPRPSGGSGKEPSAYAETLYEYLKDEWDIAYMEEPPSFEAGSQKIRLPHQVLLDWNGKKGRGTCIDLALLFAACLENRGAQPLILMFEIRPGLYHALAGCRPEKAVFPGPLLTSKACLDERSIAINVTCAARHEGYKKAKRMALDILRKEKFLFALDIATARRCGITPLPFSGRPQESPVVLKVDRRAKELAEKIGAQTGYKVYTPTHLLLALLYDGDGFTRQAFLKGRLDINKTKSILEDGLKNIRPKKRVDTLKHSEHYDAVWAFASNMAKSEGSPFVLEKHVFLALLETASQALDMALAAMKTDRRALKRDARLLLETEPFFDGEKSIFGSFCPSE